MKKLSINFTKTVLLFAFLTAPFALKAGDAELQAAHELLDATRFEKVMEDAINASVQVAKQMDPSMEDREEALRAFYNKYMSAESLRQDVAQIYSEMFTADELHDIIAFYNTSTGQKALEKMPEIMQRSMMIAQLRIMQNKSELFELISQED